MFDDKTYEDILDGLLNLIPSKMEKSEGSLIFNALAPAAWELAECYIALGVICAAAFAATAPREELILRAAEQGVVPYPSTKAVLKGRFNTEVPVGSRFSLGDLNYTAVKKIGDKEYELECETEGAIGNKRLGELTSIEFIDGLEEAQLIELLVPGTDEEETEHLREQYFMKVRTPSTSGNKYDYCNWAMECTGVGAVKPFPLAYGASTIKLVIADIEKKGASKELVEKVAAYIEERRPIGATVLVVSSIEKEIHVTADIMIQNGVNLGAIQEEFKKNLESYLQGIAFKAAYLSIARIGSLLLDTVGVADFVNLKVNNTQNNILLTEEEIAVAGVVVLGVV